MRALAASVELTRVSISRNAGGGLFVGGLGFGGGLATSVGFELGDSTVEANSGTGLVLRDVTGSLRDSAIAGNGGWGIDHQGGQITTSRMAYSSSLVEGNAKGGLMIKDETDNTYVGMRITDNEGPGIRHECVDCVWHELRDSEISSNHAQEGAGILLGGLAALRIVDSTMLLEEEPDHEPEECQGGEGAFQEAAEPARAGSRSRSSRRRSRCRASPARPSRP